MWQTLACLSYVYGKWFEWRRRGLLHNIFDEGGTIIQRIHTNLYEISYSLRNFDIIVILLFSSFYFWRKEEYKLRILEIPRKTSSLIIIIDTLPQRIKRLYEVFYDFWVIRKTSVIA